MNIRTLAAAAMTVAALGAGASSASAGIVNVADADPVTEGADGASAKAAFPVIYQYTATDPSVITGTVKIAGGTATDGTDFVGGDRSVTIAGAPCPPLAGLCTAVTVVEVKVLGDNIDEPDETLTATISGTPAQVARAQGSGFIRDDDAPAPAPKDTPKPDPAKPATPATPTTPTTPTTPGAPQTGTGTGTVTQPGQAPATTTTTTTNSTTGTTTPATGTAVDETGPRVGMVFRGLRKGKARVRVSCPTDELSCVGRLAVRLEGKTLRSAPFRMAGGKSRNLQVKLTRKQRHALRDAGVVYLRSSAFDAAGNRLVRELSFQL
jgi:hypothetical protein